MNVVNVLASLIFNVQSKLCQPHISIIAHPNYLCNFYFSLDLSFRLSYNEDTINKGVTMTFYGDTLRERKMVAVLAIFTAFALIYVTAMGAL